jgi:4-amino-4-deoxy-L-arabinose transferase-like glycosyltransferase
MVLLDAPILSRQHKILSIRMLSSRSISSAIGLLLTAAAVLYAIFHNLTEAPIHMWDESRYANNAIDMLLHKDPLVVRFLGAPDLYNTKPPLVTWLQSLSMAAFGINEWSVRFPTAVFALLTAGCLYWFSARVLRSRLTGSFAALVLVTSAGYMSDHVARTGDQDAALVFWLTFYALIFLALLQLRPEKPGRFYALIAAGVTAAVLTKGVAGFFFVPFLFIISLFPRNRFIYRHRQLYVAAGVTLVLCLGYYFLREALAPGYLQVVFQSEFLRINEAVMTWQVRPADYYFGTMREWRFWLFPLLPFMALTPLLIRKDKNSLQVFFCLVIVTIGYFCLISYPPVKLIWYDAPLYPLLALLAGMFAQALITRFFLLVKKTPDVLSGTALAAVLLIAIFFKPYVTIVSDETFMEDGMEYDGAFLRYMKSAHPKIKKIVVLKASDHPEHFDQVLFYKRAYELEHGYSIRISQRCDLSAGDFACTMQPAFLDSIAKNYSAEKLDEWNFVRLYKIDTVNPRADSAAVKIAE